MGGILLLVKSQVQKPSSGFGASKINVKLGEKNQQSAGCLQKHVVLYYEWSQKEIYIYIRKPVSNTKLLKIINCYILKTHTWLKRELNRILPSVTPLYKAKNKAEIRELLATSQGSCGDFGLAVSQDRPRRNVDVQAVNPGFLKHIWWIL